MKRRFKAAFILLSFAALFLAAWSIYGRRSRRTPISIARSADSAQTQTSHTSPLDAQAANRRAVARALGVRADRVDATLHIAAAEALKRARELLSGKPNARALAEARALLRLAAQDGNAEAALELGRLLESGLGGPVDRKGAFEAYKLAAEGGSAPAQLKVGQLLIRGEGCTTDYAAAATWLTRAAENGAPAGWTALGTMHANAQGFPQDYSAAMRLYEQAAATGDNAATVQIGLATINGWGVTADAPQGIELLKAAFAAGISDAAATLARLYETSDQFRDPEESLTWYRAAAEAGNVQAQAVLGHALAAGSLGTSDMGEAMKWLGAAGLSGDAEALTELGYVSLKQGGDPQHATEVLRQAAESGSTAAALALARMNAEVGGTSEQTNRAIQALVSDAAANGDWRALYVEQMVRNGQPFNEAVKSLSNVTLEQYMAQNTTTNSTTVTPPVPISMSPPELPAAEQLSGFSGAITVRFVVSPDGRATSPVLLQQAPPGVQKAIKDAIATWRFTPARKGDTAVATPMEIPLVFRSP